MIPKSRTTIHLLTKNSYISRWPGTPKIVKIMKMNIARRQISDIDHDNALVENQNLLSKFIPLKKTI